MYTTATKDNPTFLHSSKPFFAPAIHPLREGAAGVHNFANTPVFPHTPQVVIQPKLAINEPGDQYEQEANAMADRVMRMSTLPPEKEKSIQTKFMPTFSPAGEEGRRIQRLEDRHFDFNRQQICPAWSRVVSTPTLAYLKIGNIVYVVARFDPGFGHFTTMSRVKAKLNDVFEIQYTTRLHLDLFVRTLTGAKLLYFQKKDQGRIRTFTMDLHLPMGAEFELVEPDLARCTEYIIANGMRM